MTTPMTPTTEGKQLAADLANAVRRERGEHTIWNGGNFEARYGTVHEALARLATEHLALKAKHEEALADLREASAAIDDALPWMEAPKATSAKQRDRLATIAAKWRVETDPLVEAIKASNQLLPDDDVFLAAKELHAELSKRGYEIGRKS